MRKLGGMLLAVALGTSLATGCSQGSGAVGPIDVDPKSIEAHVTKLAGEAFKGTATAAADIGALRDALPPELALSWGNLSFDAATNSTLVTDLKLTPKDMPNVGVGISELRLFDLDVELLKARVAGQRLTEAAPLARRIDAKGISVFGLADAINQYQDAMQLPEDAWPSDVLPAPEPANPLKFQPTDPSTPVEPSDDWPSNYDDFYGPSPYQPMIKIDRYDVSIGRLILDDIQLKPYQVAPAPAAPADPYDSMATLMPMLQQLSAISQSYGIDTAAYLDFKVGFGMTEFGQKVSGDVTVASIGARGMRGGDTDGMYVRGVNYLASGEVEGGSPFSMQYTLDLMTLEDFRLGKVLDYLAKGVTPPRTESNLMSLGIWRSQNEAVKMGGKDIYTVGESMFDASGWHWFIPTKLHGTSKNTSLDLGAILEFAQQQTAAQPADPYGYDMGPSAEEIQQVLAMLNKHGLSKPTFNSEFGWNWNASNGDGSLKLSFDGDALLKVDAKYEGGFPSFKAVSDLIPENPENTDPMALQNLFQSATTLRLVELSVQDKGGLPKIYGLIGDSAAEMNGGAPMTAENVRVMASSGLEMMAAGSAQQIPEMPALLTPIANFLKSGGKLRLVAQPSKPTPFTSLAGTMMGVSMGASSPSQVIKELGLKAEHSK